MKKLVLGKAIRYENMEFNFNNVASFLKCQRVQMFPFTVLELKRYNQNHSFTYKVCLAGSDWQNWTRRNNGPF